MVAMLSILVLLCSNCTKFSWWFSLTLMVVGDQCPCNLLKVPLLVSRLLIVFVVGWCSQSDSSCRCVAILFLSYVVGDLIFGLLFVVFFFRIRALFVLLVVVVSSSLYYYGWCVRLAWMSECNTRLIMEMETDGWFKVFLSPAGFLCWSHGYTV
jgi:hypothetical protein